VSKLSTLGLSGLGPTEEPEAVDVAVPSVGVARRESRRRRTRWLLISVASMLVANALAGEHGLVAGRTAGRAHGALTAGIAEIRQENAVLRAQIHRLREDPREIEAVAREELGLMRPGERLFVVKRMPQRPSTRP
jgi:cell division protein FtsB